MNALIQHQQAAEPAAAIEPADRFEELRDVLGPFWFVWLAGCSAICTISFVLAVVFIYLGFTS